MDDYNKRESLLGEFLKRAFRSRAGSLVLHAVECTPLRALVCNMVYDPQTGVAVGSGDMQGDWDDRARRNAKYFIAVDNATSDVEFWDSGSRELVALILDGLELPPECRALEIGCGIGRLARPLSQLVREVHGVDISREMIQRGTKELASFSNIYLHHTQGDLCQFDESSFDFCYSYRVFQHIPTQEAVRRYWQEIARVMKAGGVFRFQICLAGFKRRRPRGGTWFGALFTEAEMRSILGATGFEIKAIVFEPSLKEKLWMSVIVTCRRSA